MLQSVPLFGLSSLWRGEKKGDQSGSYEDRDNHEGDDYDGIFFFTPNGGLREI